MQKESNPYQKIQHVLFLIEQEMIINDEESIFLDSSLFGENSEDLHSYGPIFSKLLRDGVILKDSWEFVDHEHRQEFPMDPLFGYRIIIDESVFPEYKKRINKLATNHDHGITEMCNRKIIRFNAEKSCLELDESIIEIPPSSWEYYICLHIFTADPGNHIAEIDVINDWDKAGSKTCVRSVYDAVGRVNKKIKNKFGIQKMLTCRGGYIWTTNSSIEN
ncbi:MAG: hypothetical protein WCG99_04090 [Candidatus Berkelbacteria bacterium]